MKVGNERLGILLFVDDDVIMMSDSEEDLQDMLNIAADYRIDFCVKFSESKSKVIVVKCADDDIDRILKEKVCSPRKFIVWTFS